MNTAPVLFCSSRHLNRAENIRAVWDAYDDIKDFARIDPSGRCPMAEDAKGVYSVIVTDEFLKDIRGKSRTHVVMIGHGIAGGKKYGLDQQKRYYTPRQTDQIDVLVASGHGAVPFCASAAGIPESRCLPLGMPRTDAYAGKVKGDGETLLAKFERAYLFAPTLRAGWEPKAPQVDWLAADMALRDGEMLAVKRHMVTREPLIPPELAGRLEHIVELHPGEPSAPYLMDCDAVVTDYSSIMLDGYLLEKPCVLLCPDATEYIAARGFYLDYPSEVSPFTASTLQGSVNMARIAADMGLQRKEREVIAKVADMCDGHATERVCELIRSIL